jgi:hypothetical protein
MSGHREQQRRVLRARIGVRWPDDVDRSTLEQAICAAISDAVETLGGELDLLQLDLAANPTWSTTGPTDRLTGRPIDTDN